MDKRLLVFAASALFASGAFAAGAGEQQGAAMEGGGTSMQDISFSEVDANGDGQISKEEAQAHEKLAEKVTDNWDQADANGDGQLDQAEFAAFQEQAGGEAGAAGESSVPEGAPAITPEPSPDMGQEAPANQ